VVIDLFSRQVVGWSLRQDMARGIVIDALRMAWFKRHPAKDAGLILRSDRGSQYASQDFRTRIGSSPKLVTRRHASRRPVDLQAGKAEVG
jgi:transposase InsO family protein